MKKNYNTPLTEVVNYNGKAIMVQYGIAAASGPVNDAIGD